MLAILILFCRPLLDDSKGGEVSLSKHRCDTLCGSLLTQCEYLVFTFCLVSYVSFHYIYFLHRMLAKRVVIIKGEIVGPSLCDDV